MPTLEQKLDLKPVPRAQLAEECKEVITASGRSQEDIADDLGVSQSAISKTMNPDRHLDALRLRVLCEIGGREEYDGYEPLTYTRKNGGVVYLEK